MSRKPLGQLLIEASVLEPAALETALAEHERSGDPLGRVLVGMGMVSEEVMIRALGHQLNLPAVQLDESQLADDALALLDHDFCREHGCVPFRYVAQGKFLDVALADPTNQDTFDEIRVRTRCNVRPHLAGAMAIDRVIRSAYGRASAAELAVTVDPASLTPEPGPREAEGDAVVIDTPPEEDAWDGDTLSAYVPLGAIGDDRETVPLDFAMPRPSPAGDDAAAAAGPTDDQLGQLRAEVRELGQTLLGQVDALRALVERDELVLRRVLGLLVDKGVCTREELVARLKERTAP